MHIVFLNRTLPAFHGSDKLSKALNPLQQRIIFVAEALARQGHEVSVFCQGTSSGLCVNQVYYRALPQLARYSRQNSLDYFIVVDDESALKLGIPSRFTLAWVHQDFTFLLEEAFDLRARLSDLFCNRSDKIIALTRLHAEQLTQCFNFHAEHVIVLEDETSFTEKRVGQLWFDMLSTLVSSRGKSLPYTSAYKEPIISVIIPTYNRSRNLFYCLKALTEQTEVAFEVIVCDDGSTDDTQAVAYSFRDRLNLRYRWQADEGFRAAEARNLGIRLARGKYLVFLDSDVIVPSTFLSAHRQALEENPGTVVNSYVYRMTSEWDEDLGLAPEVYIPKHQDILKPDSRDRYQLFERGAPVEEAYFLDSNAMSVSRKDMDKLGAFDSEFVGWGHEDTELGYRVSQQGMTLKLIKDGALAYHQYHYVSGNKEAERAANWLRLTQKYGITRWYHPLWELCISTDLILVDKNAELNPLQPVTGRWVIKTGSTFSTLPQPLVLEISDGILTGIRTSAEAEVVSLTENS